MTEKLINPWFEAHFFCNAHTDGSYRGHHEDGSSILFSESQGVLFWCPCGVNDPKFPIDGGRPHMCQIVFRNPPNGIQPPLNFGPESRHKKGVHPRWQIVSGTSLDDLTLDPSIAIGDPECWHGHIKQGVVT